MKKLKMRNMKLLYRDVKLMAKVTLSCKLQSLLVIHVEWEPTSKTSFDLHLHSVCRVKMHVVMRAVSFLYINMMLYRRVGA